MTLTEETHSPLGRLLNFLDRRSQPGIWGITVAAMAVCAVVDYVSGPELASSLLYLVPVSLASWSLSRISGRLVALVAAIVWQGTNLLAGEQLSSPWVVVWNSVVRAGVFLVVASLTSGLRLMLERQTMLSRTDSLTGILNRRALVESAERELARIERHRRPLTVLFLDVDRLKEVNDRRGHLAGDAVLQGIAAGLQRQFRGMDSVCRLGGDEYVVLLPDMTAAAARQVMPRVQAALSEETQPSAPPVSFSMGVLTCMAAPRSVEELIRKSDALMYSAKRRGGNCIEYGSYPGESDQAGPELAQPL